MQRRMLEETRHVIAVSRIDSRADQERQRCPKLRASNSVRDSFHHAAGSRLTRIDDEECETAIGQRTEEISLPNRRCDRCRHLVELWKIDVKAQAHAVAAGL